MVTRLGRGSRDSTAKEMEGYSKEPSHGDPPTDDSISRVGNRAKCHRD